MRMLIGVLAITATAFLINPLMGTFVAVFIVCGVLLAVRRLNDRRVANVMPPITYGDQT